MAYARRYPTRTRKSKPKQAWDSRNHKINYAGMARKAFAMGKIAMGLLNTEKKYFDTTASGTNSTSGAVIALTSGIARGTAENNRIGGSVLLKNNLLRFNAYYNTASGTTVEQGRLIVVRDTEDANGTAPTFADILQFTAAAQAVISPLNMNNSGRYKVILDKQFTIHQQRPVYSIDKWITFGMDKNNMGIRTVGQHAKWDSSDNIEDGHVYMFLIGTTNTNPCTYSMTNRVRFIDN